MPSSFVFSKLTFILLAIIHLTQAQEERRTESKRRCQPLDVYYEKTEKCYGEGLQGPCNALMTMKHSGDGKGECACKEFGECESDRIVGYWNGTDRCYYAFDQGPCPKGQWLVPRESTKKLGCRRIPCLEWYEAQASPPEDPEIKPNDDYIFSYKGVCYKQSTRETCPMGQKIWFSSWSLEPDCDAVSLSCMEAGTTTASLECEDGTAARDGTGGCAPLANTEDYSSGDEDEDDED